MSDSNVVDLAAHRATREVPGPDRAAQLATLAAYFEDTARQLLGDEAYEQTRRRLGGAPA